MVSFLQDFRPEFADTVPASLPGASLVEIEWGPWERLVPLRGFIAYPLEGQLPPCLDSQRLIFNDEPIPEGAEIVHSGYCGARIAVIVEMPAPKAGRWR